MRSWPQSCGQSAAQLFHTLPQGQLSFYFVLLATGAQLIQDNLAKACLRNTVGMIPNRLFGRFWTKRTITFAFLAPTAGCWLSTDLMMIAQYLYGDQ